jgi:hypothetical protein
MALYRVGTPKNRVGRYRWMVSSTPSGVGRPDRRTVLAPAQYGKLRLLPSPYAWNSLDAEKVTSSWVIRRTWRA